MDALGALVEKLTVGSCFSGIGGLELGLEWTGGFETKWQIENDEYARRVLAKHWPDVERFSDIVTVANPPPVDVICGGFPCQDVSLAGARRGLKGERSTLWGEMFRLVCEVKPRWVVAENVPGLLSSDGGRFFGNILRDLASIGFNAEWDCIPAGSIGAHHVRDRVFLLAYTTSKRRSIFQSVFRTDSKRTWHHEHFKKIGMSRNCSHNGLRMESIREAAKSGIPPVVNGISERMGDELRCIGNAVVPQVAQKIGEMILRSIQEERL